MEFNEENMSQFYIKSVLELSLGWACAGGFITFRKLLNLLPSN